MAFGLLAACASKPPEPVVDFKSDYDFQKIRTIAFMPTSGKSSGDSAQMMLSDMQVERIDRAFIHALELKGLQIVADPAKADALITWHLVAQEKTDVRSTGSGVSMGYGVGRYGGYNSRAAYSCWNCAPDVRVTQYTQGTLIVDVIDPAMQKSVWRSVIQSRLKANQEATEEERNASAKRILAKFPPI
jgi:hypothetical protein